MIRREKVYEMLSKEDKYAQGWVKNGRKKDAYVSVTTDQPFTLMEWIIFAEKYLNEAKLAYANYTPDLGTIRIRLLKATSLLVSALQVHGKEEDMERLAGVSSSKFPILHGGLRTFERLVDETGMFVGGVGNLKSEEPKRRRKNR